MTYKGSIQKRLIGLILLVVFLTSFVGYGAFVYWYMQDQYSRVIKLADTVSVVIGQNVAKLLLLNDVSAAADITSLLKSFKKLDTMVLYNLDKKAMFQYSKDDISFKAPVIKNELNKKHLHKDKLDIFIKATYQNTHLGYVYLRMNVKTLWDIVKQNIKMLFYILTFMVIVSILLAIYFARNFTDPILKLVKFLEQIDKTDSLKKRIKIVHDNEYGKLYEEINTMLSRIELAQEQLKIAAVTFEVENGITITDSNHKILKINKAFEKITGYTQDDIVGKTPAVLQSGLHDRAFYDEMFQSLRDKHFWAGEINNKRKDGKIYLEYLTIQTVLDDNNNIAYYVASFSDITQQKEYELKVQDQELMLVQQSKMAALGEMLENIAHQWRQPLSIISTIATGLSLKKQYDMPIDPQEELDNLQKIDDTIQYLSQTITDFRNFFKTNKELVTFNIDDVYKKVMNIIGSKLNSLGIIIVEEIDTVTIRSLDNELMQVLINIINNAKDILETKDTEKIIQISIYEKQGNAIIEIQDSGGGIPTDIIDRVFEPYFTTKHKSNGTGIGLYMSHEMVTKHLKGSLIVKNSEFTYNDQNYFGAKFIITIPIEKV